MPSWSAKGFFFMVIGFLIYTVAGGYAPKWKAILTNTAGLPAGNPVQPIQPIQPIPSIDPLSAQTGGLG